MSIDITKPIRRRVTHLEAKIIFVDDGDADTPYIVVEKNHDDKWSLRGWIDKGLLEEYYENVPPPTVKKKRYILVVRTSHGPDNHTYFSFTREKVEKILATFQDIYFSSIVEVEVDYPADDDGPA
jgi:hypothetical protein